MARKPCGRYGRIARTRVLLKFTIMQTCGKCERIGDDTPEHGRYDER